MADIDALLEINANHLVDKYYNRYKEQAEGEIGRKMIDTEAQIYGYNPNEFDAKFGSKTYVMSKLFQFNLSNTIQQLQNQGKLNENAKNFLNNVVAKMNERLFIDAQREFADKYPSLASIYPMKDETDISRFKLANAMQNTILGRLASNVFKFITGNALDTSELLDATNKSNQLTRFLYDYLDYKQNGWEKITGYVATEFVPDIVVDWILGGKLLKLGLKGTGLIFKKGAEGAAKIGQLENTLNKYNSHLEKFLTQGEEFVASMMGAGAKLPSVILGRPFGRMYTNIAQTFVNLTIMDAEYQALRYFANLSGIKPDDVEFRDVFSSPLNHWKTNLFLGSILGSAHTLLSRSDVKASGLLGDMLYSEAKEISENFDNLHNRKLGDYVREAAEYIEPTKPPTSTAPDEFKRAVAQIRFKELKKMIPEMPLRLPEAKALPKEVSVFSRLQFSRPELIRIFSHPERVVGVARDIALNPLNNMNRVIDFVPEYNAKTQNKIYLIQNPFNNNTILVKIKKQVENIDELPPNTSVIYTKDGVFLYKPLEELSPEFVADAANLTMFASVISKISRGHISPIQALKLGGKYDVVEIKDIAETFRTLDMLANKGPKGAKKEEILMAISGLNKLFKKMPEYQMASYPQYRNIFGEFKYGQVEPILVGKIGKYVKNLLQQWEKNPEGAIFNFKKALLSMLIGAVGLSVYDNSEMLLSGMEVADMIDQSYGDIYLHKQPQKREDLWDSIDWVRTEPMFGFPILENITKALK